MGPVERAGKTYAEQLSYAAQQLRVRALKADAEEAADLAAAAKELDAHAKMARVTNTLANARQNGRRRRSQGSRLRRGRLLVNAQAAKGRATSPSNGEPTRRRRLASASRSAKARPSSPCSGARRPKTRPPPQPPNPHAVSRSPPASSPASRGPPRTPSWARQQVNVNLAERNLLIAQEQQTAILNKLNPTTVERLRAEQQLAAAEKALDIAVREETIAATKAGASGGFGQQFGLGFKGASDRPYAEQLGQAFKFSVFYGTAYKLLSGLTQTLQQTLQEGIAFQQSMTELSIASGRTADSMGDVADNVGKSATQAGFAPSQGVSAAARSLGLFGAAAGSGATKQDQAYIAELSARIVTRIAAGSGKQPEDIQNNLAAIANAFGTGAGGQVRAFDLDAYLTKKFGVTQGSTLVPVSEAGTVGKAAGFSQSEVTAIAAALVARTGQTDTAVAGYMAQIFSRGGEGALTQVAAKYGVDPNETLSKQIAELAQIYKTATPQARAELAAVGGRGKSQNAFIALLQEYPNIISESRGADTKAGGAGDDVFNQRMKNLGGEIAQTVGAMKAFASELARSDLLKVVGGLVLAFRGLVDVATSMLRAWNSLPGIIRITAEALVALEVATRLATGGSLLTQAGRASAVGGGILGGGAGGAASAIARNAKGIGLGLAVLGDLYLWQSFKDSTTKLRDAQNSTAEVLKDTIGPGSTPDQIRSHASALADQAKQNRAADNGLFGAIADRNPLGLNHATNNLVQAQAKQMDAEAKRLTALAAAEDQFAATRGQSQVQITGFDSDNLSSSMQAITDAGGNAQDRFKALADTLDDTASAASRAAGAFQPNIFAGQNAAPLSQALQGSVFLGEKTTGFHPSTLGHALTHPISALGQTGPISTSISNIGDQRIAAALTPDQIAQRTSAALSDIGKPIGDLTAKQMRSIANAVLQDTAQKAFGDKGPEQVAAAQKYMRKVFVDYLKHQKDLADAIGRGVKLSPTEGTAAVNQLVTESQAILDALPQSDFSGRIKQAQTLVRQIIRRMRQTKGGGTDEQMDDYDAARRAVAEATIARLEALRKAAQHVAGSKAEVKSIGRGFFTREMNAAIKAGDSDALVGLIQNAGDWSIDITRNAIKQAIRVVRAAIITQAAASRYAASELAGIQGMIHQIPRTAGGPTAKQQRRLDELNNELDALSTVLPGGANNAYDTGSDANRPDAGTKDSGPTKAQIAAARQSAYAQGSESQIAIARAAIASARADMAAAKKGTVEYYSALGEYLSARNSLTDAIQEYHKNIYLLTHDITNPLTQARAETRAAAAKLRSDAGKPADVRAADRVSLEQAQASQESTAFQQRLETVQTAEQLGRMSHAAYIRYLQNESRRLNNIKDRTYQQQQELNQIDGLLQDAAKEMEGQFNIAGIKLPTVYQVRRAIAERSGAAPGRDQMAARSPGSVNSNNTTYIQIDGADYTKVKRLVTDEMGKAGRVVTGAPRKRV